MDKIYILLPVHNRREITRKFIECLKLQTHQNYHLVLIDDGSTDGTEKIVQSQIQALTVIKGKGDWWWAGSLQQGYLWMKSQNLTSSDLVLIINDFLTQKTLIHQDIVQHFFFVEIFSIKYFNNLPIPHRCSPVRYTQYL